MTATGLGGGPTLTPLQTQYAYDGDGNLVAITDSQGATTHFKFDALDRKSAMMYNDGSSETYRYDSQR